MKNSNTVSNGLMNDTKWREIRRAMLELDVPPHYRTLCLDNGYLSNWDAEWFYHFYDKTYSWVQRLEIRYKSPEQRIDVLNALTNIGVHGVEEDQKFVVFGYAEEGVSYNYITEDKS